MFVILKVNCNDFSCEQLGTCKDRETAFDSIIHLKLDDEEHYITKIKNENCIKCYKKGLLYNSPSHIYYAMKILPFKESKKNL